MTGNLREMDVEVPYSLSKRKVRRSAFEGVGCSEGLVFLSGFERREKGGR